MSQPRKLPQAADSLSSRILAIDYGQKRIGLALSDGLGLTAQPLAVFERRNREADLKKLRQICANHSIGRIIVGHPLHIGGEISDMAVQAARFAARLEKALHIEVELVDERLTSWEARRLLKRLNDGRARARHAVDDVAAAILLRDYLEHQNELAVAREKN